MKKLNDLQKKVESINQQSVPASEILTPAFLLRHTPFGSADEMYQASGFKIEIAEDFAAIPDEEWDAFIRSISSFTDWKSMLNEASKEWATRKLGLK